MNTNIYAINGVYYFLYVVMPLTKPSVFMDIMPIHSYFTRSTANDLF